jgi:hypothetical protein
MIIGDPPGQVKVPVDCVLAAHATMSSCSHALADDWWETYDAIAQSTRSIHGGFLDTRGFFCSRVVRPMVIGHTIAYNDQYHVSRTYSAELAGPFRTLFRMP